MKNWRRFFPLDLIFGLLVNDCIDICWQYFILYHITNFMISSLWLIRNLGRLKQTIHLTSSCLLTPRSILATAVIKQLIEYDSIFHLLCLFAKCFMLLSFKRENKSWIQPIMIIGVESAGVRLQIKTLHRGVQVVHSTEQLFWGNKKGLEPSSPSMPSCVPCCMVVPTRTGLLELAAVRVLTLQVLSALHVLAALWDYLVQLNLQNNSGE